MTQHAEPGARTDAFRLYDTATQSVRLLEPVVSGRVSIYHCGLTVQSGPHLGHIRKEVVFDVLRRWLTWSGYEVTVIAKSTTSTTDLIKSARSGSALFAPIRLTGDAARTPRSLPAIDVRAAGDRHIPG